ncbi:MAG: hypothetical protein QMD11_11500 [Smithella sp.]|nr:hypothetical protein [Smithella sp.]
MKCLKTLDSRQEHAGMTRWEWIPPAFTGLWAVYSGECGKHRNDGFICHARMGLSGIHVPLDFCRMSRTAEGSKIA